MPRGVAELREGHHLRDHRPGDDDLAAEFSRLLQRLVDVLHFDVKGDKGLSVKDGGTDSAGNTALPALSDEAVFHRVFRVNIPAKELFVKFLCLCCVSDDDFEMNYRIWHARLLFEDG